MLKFVLTVFVESELSDSDPLLVLMKDQFGNFVVKNVYAMCDNEYKKILNEKLE